jgi:Rieske Fe-S protein
VAKYLTPQVSYAKSWPQLKIVNVNSLQVLKPITFYYPLVNQPNYLIKLGVPAKGGVGPDNDIVAFSQICQHLGCFWNLYGPGQNPSCPPRPGCSPYTRDTPYAFCCCHGSHYDLTNGGALLSEPPCYTTPAPLPLPQAKLDVDSSGNIIIKGMTPPNIFGYGPTPRLPASQDPKDIPTVPDSLLLEYDTFNGVLVDQSTILGTSATG